MKSGVVTSQDRINRAEMTQGVIFPESATDEQILIKLRVIGVDPSLGGVFNAINTEGKIFDKFWERKEVKVSNKNPEAA